MSKILWVVLLFLTMGARGERPVDQGVPEQNVIIMTPQISLPIGIKIWFNESGGTVDGLTTWNENEGFASLGIGHFLWHPRTTVSDRIANRGNASYTSGFPALVTYVRQRGGYVPSWLNGDALLYCPWSTREEFYRAKNSPKMVELKDFLQRTIPLQAEYMAKNLQNILPELLACTPSQDRHLVYRNFHAMARTPNGLYALVDYLNFKGAGISRDSRNYEYGSGLLHVLKEMKNAPPGYTPLRAYTWAAKHALTRRVMRSSPEQGYDRWLKGWFKRLNTYLEGDLGNMQVIL